MHGFGLPQRHAEGLIRRGAVLAAAALASTALLASGATASTADFITPSPLAAPISQLESQFYVSGTVTDVTEASSLPIAVNGTVIGSATFGDTQFSGSVTPNPVGQPGGLACGPNTVSVEAPPFEGPGPVLASATLTAECTSPTPTPTPTAPAPTITLNPKTITRASEPAMVSVTGATFRPRLPVTVAINGHDPVTATPVNGGFTVAITAAGLGCGTQQVTAVQQGFTVGSAASASAPLVVTGCGKLAIDPAVLQPGELTHVTGTGFVAGQPVTLTWRLPHGGPPLLGRLPVTADGKGGIATWFMVMPGDLLGQRVLVATQAGTSVTANAVVDGGPMEPSSGDRLIYRAS